MDPEETEIYSERRVTLTTEKGKIVSDIEEVVGNRLAVFDMEFTRLRRKNTENYKRKNKISRKKGFRGIFSYANEVKQLRSNYIGLVKEMEMQARRNFITSIRTASSYSFRPNFSTNGGGSR